jgi:3-deoxy-manno-octulosonate cytidylyltransferase (CMP-KDO synthetase)
MSVAAIIPARYASTRFPGKPLARQTGKYLVQHVWERVRAADCFERVAIATDDERIASAVVSFGGEVVLTRPDHATGTDRIAEVVAKWRLADDALVVNVQGDEPEIDPESLKRLVQAAGAEAVAPVATLACPFPEGQDPQDPSAVKVVRNLEGRALYFSRSMVPYVRDVSDGTPSQRVTPLLHLGVYAYRAGFLLAFAKWPATPLEQAERLEQLRILENGVQIAVVVVDHPSVGIDTPEDYARFVERVSPSAARTAT